MIRMITDSANFRHNVQCLAAVALLAAMLSGCTTAGVNSEDLTNRLLTAPGKYVLYNCEQLGIRATGVAARQKQLLGLMAKAESGADGRLVSAVAYRPEYNSLRGDMNELRRAAAAEHCKSMPALENSAGRMSDSAVR
jgi:hypothetical protein